MTSVIQKHGFLAAALLIILAASAFHLFSNPAVDFGLLVFFGTATVNYTWPVTTIGQTTPPSANSMLNYNSVRGTITFGDTDTTATFTHNMSFSTTQLAQLFPDLSFYFAVLTTPAETAPPVIQATLAANAVTFTKQTGTDTGGVMNVLVARPWSGVT